MSLPARPLLLASVLLLGSLLVAPADVGAQDEPQLQHMAGWSVGDYWVWQQQPGPGVPAQTQGELKHKVVAAEVVTNQMYDADEHQPDWHKQQVWRVRGWANQTSQTSIGPVESKGEFERFQRQDDHAIVRLESETQFGYTGPSAGQGLPTSTSAIMENFPPQITFMWPFAVGDEWRMRVYQKKLNTGNAACGGADQPSCQVDHNLLNTFEVITKDTVSVRVNGAVERFEAYRIKDTDEFSNTAGGENAPREYDLYWWSPKACNWIKREKYDENGALQAIYTLKEYQCARRSAPDPTYRVYDPVNFSSTRLHGALEDEPLEFLKELTKPGNAARKKGFFESVAEGIPGPNPALILALVALAALAVRRRR